MPAISPGVVAPRRRMGMMEVGGWANRGAERAEHAGGVPAISRGS